MLGFMIGVAAGAIGLKMYQDYKKERRTFKYAAQGTGKASRTKKSSKAGLLRRKK